MGWSNGAVGLGLLAVLGLAASASAASGKPPEALVKLEREVGLRVAHARDVGPTEPLERKRLSEAEQYDGKGEQALKAGDYDDARGYFLRARQLLDQLGI